MLSVCSYGSQLCIRRYVVVYVRHWPCDLWTQSHRWVQLTGLFAPLFIESIMQHQRLWKHSIVFICVSLHCSRIHAAQYCFIGRSLHLSVYGPCMYNTFTYTTSELFIKFILNLAFRILNTEPPKHTHSVYHLASVPRIYRRTAAVCLHCAVAHPFEMRLTHVAPSTY